MKICYLTRHTEDMTLFCALKQCSVGHDCSQENDWGHSRSLCYLCSKYRFKVQLQPFKIEGDMVRTSARVVFFVCLLI